MVQTYENFLNKFFEKSKIAKKIVVFLNSMDPNFNCYYHNNGMDKIDINNSDKRLNKSYTIMDIEKLENSYDISFFELHSKSKIEISQDVRKFMVNPILLDKTVIGRINGDINWFRLDSNYVQIFLENLTKEKYEDFLIEMDAKKYNL